MATRFEKMGEQAKRGERFIREKAQGLRGRFGGPTGQATTTPVEPAPQPRTGVGAKPPPPDFVNDTTKRAAKRGLLRRGVGLASRASVPLTAGYLGFEAGQAGTEAALKTDTGKGVVRDLGLGGEKSDITGQDLADQFTNPDQVRPQGDINEGGFATRNPELHNKINPNISFEDANAASRGLTDATSRVPTAEDILAGNLGVQEEEAEAPGESEVATEVASPGTTVDPSPRGQSKKLTLRDALAGFKRTGNPLADAAVLQGRLGLTSAANTSRRASDEFAETQRQNDFENAIALNDAQLDSLEASGKLDAQDLAFQKEENAVFRSQKDDIMAQNISDEDKQTQITEAASIQAKKQGYLPESEATQTLFTSLMQQVNQEAPSGVLEQAFAAANPFGDEGFSFGDIGQADAPNFNAQTIRQFSVENGTLRFSPSGRTGLGGKGSQPVVDLDDLPKSVSQSLIEILDAQKRR